MAATDTRSPEQIRHHYELERELADRLRRAEAPTRRRLYTQVYNELYARVPDIPHLTPAASQTRNADVAGLVEFLRPFLSKARTFMEIGPGDFKLSMAVSKLVSKVYAVDVTDEVVGNVALPPSVEFVLTDGFDIAVPSGVVDVAFSDQVVEHLHPDDAAAQLCAIHATLAPGGKYICITPNRLYGPHDVSQYFDSVATGLHLKEYTVSEVADLFRACGFSRVEAFTITDSREVKKVSLPAVSIIEHSLDRLPLKLKRGLACSAAFKALLRSRVVGYK